MQIVACDARPGLFLVLTRRPRSNVPQGNESTELTSAKYIMMNTDPDSDLHLLDLRENKFYPLRHIASLEGRQRLAWSPDGDYIALVSEYKLKIGYFKENDRPEFRRYVW
jgi:dipeptidyl aminopeptidase/acylaminoacyl peptidase